jgi:hypothetical protein
LVRNVYPHAIVAPPSAQLEVDPFPSWIRNSSLLMTKAFMRITYRTWLVCTFPAARKNDATSPTLRL